MKALETYKLDSTRRLLGLTRRELAENIGIGESTLACWELGHREPRYEHLIKWCNALQLTPNDVLGGVKKNG